MKKRSNFLSFIIFLVFLTSILFVCGCSIFKSIGDGISSAYENTVTYFNCYYNASRLMSEAENEIAEDTLNARDKGPDFVRSSQLPAETKQKLNKVIDKCSNILSLHSTSGLVDDALFLIGKSYFYQGEYLKSERKFEELISQFPTSSLNLESKLWLSRLKLHLKKYDEGIVIAKDLIEDASKRKQKDVAIEAYKILGFLYICLDEYEKAEDSFKKILQLTADKDIISSVHITLGDLYAKQGNDEKAIESYLYAKDIAKEKYSIFQCVLQSAICYRRSKQLEKAMDLLNQLIEDFRYKPFLPALQYEKANNYLDAGKIDEAISEYKYVDTTYKDSEHSIRSAYKLAYIYEKVKPDYSMAAEYYRKVSLSKSIQDLEDSKLKASIFGRYFDCIKRIYYIDSVLSVLKKMNNADTTQGRTRDEIITSNSLRDTTIKEISVADAGNKLDSNITFAKNDTSKISKNVFTIKDLDSLMFMKAIAAQELGDIFYSDLGRADSAYKWYINSLNYFYDTVHSPRILYILADLARSNPGGDILTEEDYYNRLNRDFPRSIYTYELGRILNNFEQTIKTDSVELVYSEAEKLIESKKYTDAIRKLELISKSYPNSIYAPKSLYAAGWIYENYLNIPDSARSLYRNVRLNYPETIYAGILAKKIIDTADLEQKSVQAPPKVNGSSKEFIDSLSTKGNLSPTKIIDTTEVQKKPKQRIKKPSNDME